MYFFNTKKLATQIKEGTLSEIEKKNYYISVSLISVLCLYLAGSQDEANFIAALIEGTLLVAITIFGINITFSTNNGSDGNDYIARAVTLSLPILINIFIASIVVGIIIGVIIGVTMGVDNESNFVLNQEASVSISIAASVIYFWRLNVHLRYVNT